MRILLVLVVSVFLGVDALSQSPQIIPELSLIGTNTEQGKVPFWLRSNQYGSIPVSGPSLSLIPSVIKKYHKPSKALLDWGLGAQARINVGNTSNYEIIEGYIQGRLSIFELKAGRSKDITGLCDSTLGSGSFSVSGNALGIPKVQISIPEYYNLPILWRLFSFKGNFSHGWLGDVEVNPRPYPITTYFHQKTLYGKFGKPNWRINFIGGFNHQVFWGNEEQFNTKNYNLSQWETYQSVVFGKTFGVKDIPRSKIGNHVGSLDIGFEVRLNKLKILCYRQNFYDTGALYYLQNIEDGLQGISITNINVKKSNRFRINKILFELFYSKNQAAEDYSGATNSGDEDYYNNYIYKYGWTYNSLGIGTPLITNRDFTQTSFPDNSINKYYINNRVIAFHTGSEGKFFGLNYLYKVTYSMNYGTYTIGYTPDQRFRIHKKVTEIDQWSTYLELNKELRNKYKIGIGAAMDNGKLLEDGVGVFLKASKIFSRN